jgi:hypothetical protein
MFHFTCDRCGLHRDIRYLPRVYELARDRYVTMEQRHIWCSGCNDISVCESLVRSETHLEHIRNALQKCRALRDNPPQDLSTLKRFERDEIERAPRVVREIEQEERDWQEWRAQRSAPVRCLKCSSPVEYVPSDDWQSLAHAGCGGTLQCTASIGSFNGPATYPHIYDVNGVFLERGRKPKLRPGQLNPEYVPMELFYGDTEGHERS